MDSQFIHITIHSQFTHMYFLTIHSEFTHNSLACIYIYIYTCTYINIIRYVKGFRKYCRLGSLAWDLWMCRVIC